MTRRANTSDSPLRPAPPGPSAAAPAISGPSRRCPRCQITVGERTTTGSGSPGPDDRVHVVLPGDALADSAWLTTSTSDVSTARWSRRRWPALSRRRVTGPPGSAVPVRLRGGGDGGPEGRRGRSGAAPRLRPGYAVRRPRRG